MRQQQLQVTQFRNGIPLINQTARQQGNSHIAINYHQAGFRPSLHDKIGAVDFSCNLGNGQSHVNKNQFDLPQQSLAGKRYIYIYIYLYVYELYWTFLILSECFAEYPKKLKKE